MSHQILVVSFFADRMREGRISEQLDGAIGMRKLELCVGHAVSKPHAVHATSYVAYGLYAHI